MVKTILIIEDETSIRENIEEMLTLKNFKTITAVNGSDGFLKILKYKPDLIISDVSMPVMDGWDLLQNVRNHKEVCNTPFLFLTAKADKSDLRKGMDLGADDYLVKPFTVDELLNAIKIRIDRQQQIHEELTQKINYYLKQLNNSASHEYNTPLTGILGFSDLILMSYDNFSGDQIKEFVGWIKESGLRLQKTVEKNMLFRNLTALKPEDIQKIKDKFVSYTINAKEISRIAEKNAIKFKRNTDWEVVADEAQLTFDFKYLQIILNELTENAFKFSEPGTKVQIQGTIHEQSYKLSFYNEGIGFKPSDINNIAPFTQFDRDLHEQQGSGIGLFNVKKICELFGLNFLIESEQNKFVKATIEF